MYSVGSYAESDFIAGLRFYSGLYCKLVTVALYFHLVPSAFKYRRNNLTAELSAYAVTINGYVFRSDYKIDGFVFAKPLSSQSNNVSKNIP